MMPIFLPAILHARLIIFSLDTKLVSHACPFIYMSKNGGHA